MQTHTTNPDSASFAATHGRALIYGLDPLRVDHAQIIINTPEAHTPMRRTLAFATLKEARGETIDRARMIAATLAASRLRVVQPTAPIQEAV